MILLSSLLLIVAGDTVVACGVTAVACIQTLAGILAGGPAVIGFPAVEDVLAVASIPARPCLPVFARRFTYWTVKCDILQDYRTIGLLLSDCNLFLLSDIGSRPQSIGLSDVGLRKNQRLPTSA